MIYCVYLVEEFKAFPIDNVWYPGKWKCGLLLNPKFKVVQIELTMQIHEITIIAIAALAKILQGPLGSCVHILFFLA